MKAIHRFLSLLGVVSALTLPVRAAQSAPDAAFPFTAGFNAPALARTATTVLLLWDRFAPDEVATYEIRADGIAVARTGRLSHLVTGLAAGRTYRFSVSALDANGRVLAETPVIEAATKPAGVVLNVRDRGAAGDGRTLDTAAIQAAINACPVGGTVLVPAGTYRVDHLDLKSDLTLELAKGATLRFLGRGEGHYVDRFIRLTGPDGPVDVKYGALITGVRTDNVALIGEGTIQANGESWWPAMALRRSQNLPEDRPKVFQVIDARNLLIQGITVEDPPFWNTHAVYVDHVVVANVTFLRRSPVKSVNADGLDLDSTRQALVVGCRFGNQDDSVALKCGRYGEGQTMRQRSVENVVIRDCLFDRTLGPMSNPLGIAIGSETCGQVRHVLVKDCVFRGVASIINIKTNRDRRHALVEDVTVENCDYANDHFADEPWNRAPIALDAFYFRRPEDPDAAATTPDAPYFRNIHFRNITIDNPLGYAVYITGLAERPLENVTFTNVTAKSKVGLYARNIDGLTLDRVTITPATGPAVQTGVNVTNLRVLPLSGNPAGSASTKP